MASGQARPSSDVGKSRYLRPSLQLSRLSLQDQSRFVLPDLSLENWSNYIRLHLDGDQFDVFASDGPLSGLRRLDEDTKEDDKDYATEDVTNAPSQKSSQQPTGLKLLTILLGLCIAVFCVALDNTIIATAIPYITDQFKNLNDVGWYGSVYLLTTCSFQLLFGKLYKYFNIKAVVLIALFVFETGSLICAVAPNSLTLIIGRRSCSKVQQTPNNYTADSQQGPFPGLDLQV